MKSFTRTELLWMADLLTKEVTEMARTSPATGLEERLLQLRMKQYNSIAERLEHIVKDDNRRIEVTL